MATLDSLEALEDRPREVFEGHFRQVLGIVGEVEDVDVEPDHDRGDFALYKRYDGSN